MMRRLKRDRGKPIPVHDLQQIAKFRAELEVAPQWAQHLSASHAARFAARHSRWYAR
jgi:predicted nucleotide-binding protein (sugar kinase/HSP70/actin superfamily)